MTFNGEKLKTLRTKKDMTQRDLAGRLGVDAQTVSNWETGQTVPSLSHVGQLLTIFGVKMGEMFKG